MIKLTKLNVLFLGLVVILGWAPFLPSAYASTTCIENCKQEKDSCSSLSFICDWGYDECEDGCNE